jgi:hypothetical protein
MGAIAIHFIRIYVSDASYTAAILLAFGLLGATTGMWLPTLG